MFFSQTNELVMSLDDDDRLILQDGATLAAAGVGTSLPFEFVGKFSCRKLFALLQGTIPPQNENVVTNYTKSIQMLECNSNV